MIINCVKEVLKSNIQHLISFSMYKWMEYNQAGRSFTSCDALLLPL